MDQLDLLDISKESSAPTVGDGDLVHERYPMDALLAKWKQQEEFGEQRHVQITGVDDTLAACMIADLARRIERPVLLLCPSMDSARKLANDLELFSHEAAEGDILEVSDADEDALPQNAHEVALYPEYDVGPFHQASPDRKITMQRLATLHRLADESVAPPSFVVTCASALMRRTMPKATMQRMSRTWEVETSLENDELRKYLGHCGYLEVPVVEDPGTYAIRGDIVDVFPPLSSYPIRLERWGDEVAEIRSFHPQTQRTIEELSSCTICPVRQEILDREAISIAHERLYELGGERAVPTAEIQTILGDLRVGLHFIGIDALLPALHAELADLCDYITRDTLLVIVKPDATFTAMKNLWDKREKEEQVTIQEGRLAFTRDAYYRSPERFIEWVSSRKERVDVSRVAISTVSDGSELTLPKAKEAYHYTFRARSNDDLVRMRKATQGIEQMMKELSKKLDVWVQEYGRICFACRTRSQVERLDELLKTFWGGEAMVLPTPIDVSETIAPPAHIVEIYHAPLTRGFRSQMLGLCLIAGQEIFGQRVATNIDPSRNFSEQAAISHFRELTIGDLVVHIDFGIGRYQGLTHLEIEGIGNDFLLIDYADGKLYLPVYRLGRLQRYIGATEFVRLDKLKGDAWEKTKEKVKENIRAIAGELLTLYARREMAEGIAYSPPGDDYREFEERFPFEETPDQARAIAETIKDMTRVRPMDRLICGDVGFGKTEVGIRAAMKAVLDGRQVAVLVPTTILAEQHQISFRKRMEEHGAVVECLSRFRSTKESNDIIARTEKGGVDVLIGTHRLLNKKVKFRDLGLLVVDEEQRFGVTHKEKIKKLKNDIDVLTLSATPIPRTLQMSLLGIRDLSIIATPPHNRLAVRTHVAKFSDGIIREAVMRELERGGQVFFVHNRVATIQQMAEHLEELVPEARIGVGHGQMTETKLEEVMLSYVKGEINVLLCTSIIESGLDIPNANTIIVNRADMFGLSQLYQLRGRVGRGKERAYAYLLIPARAKLARDAERRLEVIQTHTELGSGFHVASYDLEIRGSGNLLGDDQSGHVTAVGLDLYNELLEEAVNEIRGEENDNAIEPEVNIPITSYIPDSYIPATGLRLMFYKRYSLARTMDELDLVFDEMIDRFGQAPDSVQNLRQIVAVKIGLRRMRARKLDAGPSAISIELDPKTALDPGEVLRLVEESRGRLVINADMKLIYKLRPDESAAPLKTSRKLIDTLLATL